MDWLALAEETTRGQRHCCAWRGAESVGLCSRRHHRSLSDDTRTSHSQLFQCRQQAGLLEPTTWTWCRSLRCCDCSSSRKMAHASRSNNCAGNFYRADAPFVPPWRNLPTRACNLSRALALSLALSVYKCVCVCTLAMVLLNDIGRLAWSRANGSGAISITRPQPRPLVGRIPLKAS